MHSSVSERQLLSEQIYGINGKDFVTVAIDVWKFQYYNNKIYNEYCDLIGINPSIITEVHQIPFLPIEMFRKHAVKTGDWKEEVVFRSSGTTRSIQSHHHIRSLDWHHHFAELTFSSFFENPGEYTWLGLLPSYLERSDSSLVDMVHYFMQIKKREENKFYPALNDELIENLNKLKSKNQLTILLGVSFALLDLFEKYRVPVWENLLVIETGGMKGRDMEITRGELYARLKQDHPDIKIGSEYGMTELTSQAYMNESLFKTGPAMRVYTRDISDPLTIIGYKQRGALNIIDLGNLDTCAFIATDDVGMTYENGTFDVIGRLDQSEIRGCNLLYN